MEFEGNREGAPANSASNLSDVKTFEGKLEGLPARLPSNSITVHEFAAIFEGIPSCLPSNNFLGITFPNNRIIRDHVVKCCQYLTYKIVLIEISFII